MKVVVVVIFGFLVHTAPVTCDDGHKGRGQAKEKEAAKPTQTLPHIAIQTAEVSSSKKVIEAPKEPPKIAIAAVSPAPGEKTDKPATAPCAPEKAKEPTCQEKVVAHKVQKARHKFYHEVCKYCSPHKVTNFPVGIPHEHLEVVPLYGGGYAVPVNDVDGQLISYINIGDDADFVVEEVNGVRQLVLPCTDVATGQDIMVHLGSADGHLVLRDFHIGGQAIQGFVDEYIMPLSVEADASIIDFVQKMLWEIGEASCGDVIVPAVYHGSKMVVLRTAYRLEQALHYDTSP